MLKRFLKEPFVHFLLLGAAIFLFYALVSDDDTPDITEIVVTKGQIERLVTGWRRTRMRPPTRAELDGLIEEYLREEIYYREAVAMGLDLDDAIIRRRLRQKMEFVTHDLADQVQPSDAELQQYLVDTVDRYRQHPQLSFTHIFFSRDQRGQSAADDAALVLAEIAENPAAQTEQLGDSLMLPARVDDMNTHELRNLFGQEFVDQVSSLPVGTWQGPVSSGYGLHLVRIDEMTAARVPELGEIRERVANDWQNEQRDTVNDEIYRGLRERYSIVLEQPDWMTDENAVDVATGNGQ